jgi:hypothetical protein
MLVRSYGAKQSQYIRAGLDIHKDAGAGKAKGLG